MGVMCTNLANELGPTLKAHDEKKDGQKDTDGEKNEKETHAKTRENKKRSPKTSSIVRAEFY